MSLLMRLRILTFVLDTLPKKMTSELSLTHEQLVEDGRNKTKLFCERCNSTVLLPNKAVYCEVEVH